MKKLSKRSIGNLEGVDPRLCVIIGAVLSRGIVDLTITDGLRTAEEQHQHFLNGASKLDGYNKKSYHQTGKAIDFIPYPFNGWDDIDSFKAVGEELKTVAKMLGYQCTYGGDWTNFKDYPHFQLD